MPTSRNLDKIDIGKFTIDLYTLKQNILNVICSSCRGSVENLKERQLKGRIVCGPMKNVKITFFTSGIHWDIIKLFAC